MMSIVYNQLAIDYNCKPEDFNKDGVIFTIAESKLVDEKCLLLHHDSKSLQWAKVRLLMYRKI